MALRTRLRTVPATFAETVLPRWAWWACTVFTAGAAVFLTYCTVRDDWPRGTSAIAFAGLALIAWAASATMFVLILRRPRHSAEDLAATASRVVKLRSRISRETGTQNSFGVLIPGSARLSWASAAMSASVTVAFVLLAIAADGGWRVFWLVATLPFLTSLFANALAIRSRWILLTPERLYIQGSRTTAHIAWDDIADVSYTQGYDSLMVFRLETLVGARPTITHRHPFTRRRSVVVDVEPATFDLDPLLLFLAIESYRRSPNSRSELKGPTPPGRLTDPAVALLSADHHTELEGFRPENRRARQR